jgi:hypothetical protein
LLYARQLNSFHIASTVDPSAFSANPDGVGILPDSAVGDFAVGLAYSLYASGLGSVDIDLGVLLGEFCIFPI